MKDITKKYANGEITIIWKPALCTHSTRCWKGAESLPEVFNPKIIPWIDPLAAPTERMIEQIQRCPSGALSFVRNGDTDQQNQQQQ
ncbi:MAG: (4Fe-4S)-binding protein [Cytophagales bacterium]|nr:(4Fe-4S)-binding protein [Cytophaga sp.]